MIKDLQQFKSDAWEDFRGDIYTIWDESYPKLNWQMDKVSHSRKNTLRGLHGDFKTWKLISCVQGKFYLIVADNREDSPTYKDWDSFVLSAENRKQVLVPPGCGNGHFILSDDCTFHYKLVYEGDYVDIECDGTKFYATGVTQDDAGVALA